MIEETKDGLNIEIVDQDGRSMFPEGAKDPYERTRRLVQKLAGRLRQCRTASPSRATRAASRVPPRPGYGPWELSADRANAVRQILEDEPACRIASFMVAGQGRHASRCFPDDPYIAANRRVTITLMREAPPLPAGLQALTCVRASCHALTAAFTVERLSATLSLGEHAACAPYCHSGHGVL